MNSVIRVRAFAKINLSLRILGPRADGYHELRTVFQAIALHDTLSVRRVAGPFELTCSDSKLPVDRTNLVWRAARALWKGARRRGLPRGVAVHLTKRIPVQAGLGGGSSDAAAALRVLARVWCVDSQCVREAAVHLGADVPFFLEGGTVLGLERGDVLFPLVDPPPAWVLVLVPAFGVSTSEAYAWWDADRGRSTDGGGTDPGRRRDGPGTEEGRRRDGGNDLQPSVARRWPEIARMIRDLGQAGAECARMSGSGSAVFGLFGSEQAAARAARLAAAPNRQAFVTRTLTRAEYQRLAGN